MRPGWVVASGGLYLLALSCSACYWYRLLAIFGNRPPFLKAYRAYFLILRLVWITAELIWAAGVFFLKS